MGHQQKVHGFVLSRRNVGEADRLVTFFTREHGVVRAVAKGVRKIPSQRGGHLEPYTLVLALISQSGAGTYIGAVETQKRYSELVGHGDALMYARNISSVIMHLCGEFDSQEELFRSLSYAWRVLPRVSAARQRMIEAAIIVHILRIAGLMPDLRLCVVCGASSPSESVVLDAVHGGWKCLLCHAELKSAQYSLSPRLLQAFRFMVSHSDKALLLRASDSESEQLLACLHYFVSAAVPQPVKWYTVKV